MLNYAGFSFASDTPETSITKERQRKLAWTYDSAFLQSQKGRGKKMRVPNKKRTWSSRLLILVR